MFVFVSKDWVIICPAIGNPSSYEIRVIIPFLHEKFVSDVEIHRELCTIYDKI
jgi:hypothetical protein